MIQDETIDFLQFRIECLEQARDLIIEAENLMDTAIHGLSIEDHYHAYGRYGINQLLNNGNPYDEGIEEVIEHVKDLLNNMPEE